MSNAEPASASTDATQKDRGPERLGPRRDAEIPVHIAEARRHARLSWWLGLARLAVFAAACAFLIQATRTSPDLVYRRVLPTVVAFALVVRVHVLVRRRQERARRRSVLARESRARLEGTCGPGAPARLPRNPVSNLDAGRAASHEEGDAHALDAWVLEDLGIDGEPPSLFELLNTTQSPLGARRLRVVLRTPLLEPDAITARQAAVRELARDHELRDALMLAAFSGRNRSVARVPGFLSRRPDFPQGWFRVSLAVLGAAVLPLLFLAPRVPVLWPFAGGAFLLTFALSMRLRRRSGEVRESYLELEPVLRTVVDLARVLQARPPRSPLLVAYAQRFHNVLHGPHRLTLFLRDTAFLHLHEIGFLYGLVELLTSWDLHWLMSLEARARRVPGQLQRYVEAASDLEALVALATFCAEQSGVEFPEVVAADAPVLEIGAGEHPLLARGRVVANDLALGGQERLAVVTGSNMSGKSTFLRMVALNTVLAQIGAPVRAAKLRMTPLRLHANINVHDSLADGKSYFLVEVERVHAILAAARSHRFVFAVLDELFRGTNSTERLAASREIARYLAASGSFVLLATHELELTRLVFDDNEDGMFTLHFRDEIRDGRMVFPYTVERGVGEAHNALRLLELSGYPPDVVERARAHAARHRLDPGAE